MLKCWGYICPHDNFSYCRAPRPVRRLCHLRARGVAAATIASSRGAQPGVRRVTSPIWPAECSPPRRVARRASASQRCVDVGGSGAAPEGSVRDYFVAHPQEYQELRAIAAPLSDPQRGCNAAIQPMQIAALYQALSQSGASSRPTSGRSDCGANSVRTKAAMPRAATIRSTFPQTGMPERLDRGVEARRLRTGQLAASR